MDRVNENVIEWVKGSDTISITASDRAFITKIKSICDKYKEDVKYFRENDDGSIYVRISKHCLSIGAKKKVNMTELQKAELRCRLAEARNKK